MGREYTVAVVGATGLVGQTMWSVLAERGFPSRSFASSRRRAPPTPSSPGRAGDRRRGDDREDSFDGRRPGPDRDGQRHLEALLADRRAGRRGRRRQQLGLPPRGLGAARRARGQPGRRRRGTRGSSPTRTARPSRWSSRSARSTRSNPIKRIVGRHLPVGLRAPARRRSRSFASRSARTRPGREAEIAPASLPVPDRVQPLPAHRRLDGRRLLREEWKMVRETRKIMHLERRQDRRHDRARAGLLRPLRGRARRADRADDPGRGAGVLREAPGVVVQDDLSRERLPDAASGERARTRSSSDASGETTSSTTGSRCGSSRTTSGRAPRSTPSRSPSCSSPRPACDSARLRRDRHAPVGGSDGQESRPWR